MAAHVPEGDKTDDTGMSSVDARELRARLRPSWELPTIAALYFSLFVLRDTGTPDWLDFDVARGLIVLAIIVLTVRAAQIPTTAGSIHIAMAVIVLLLDVISAGIDASWLDVVTKSLSLYLVGYSTIALLVFLLQRRRVSGDAIFGAVAVYLSIGIFFGLVYTLIGTVEPEAFNPPQDVGGDKPSQLFYFSYVTLTTLGFGDIQPAVSLTRVLAALEAITGVVLLATLVGRFVGMLVAQASDEQIIGRLDELALHLRSDHAEPDAGGSDPHRPGDNDRSVAEDRPDASS